MSYSVKEILSDVTDIHIKAEESPGGALRLCEGNTLFFPGPRAPESEAEIACEKEIWKRVSPISRSEFTVEVGDVIFRAQRSAQAIDGIWYRLRKMSDVAPTLQTIPTRFHEAIERILMHQNLSSGGLVLICGAPVPGKRQRPLPCSFQGF